MASRRSKTTYTFAVTIPDLEGITIPQMREYIREAIAAHRSGLDPEDALFHVDFSNTKVHLTNKEVKYG